MKKLKRYKKAPLAFHGQKRYFIKYLEKALNEIVTNNGEDWIIVDLLGGSGLLAHNCKRLKPQARVIFNDYDNYSERIANIDQTNALRELIYSRVQAHGVKHREPFTKALKEDIKQTIMDFKLGGGYVDFLSLVGWLSFGATAGRITTIPDLFNGLHNRIPKEPHIAVGYLDGLEIVKKDFKELIKEITALKTDQQKILFIADPPYIGSHQKTYKQEFTISDFWDLLSMLKEPYIFFCPDKSQMLESVQWIVNNTEKIETIKKHFSEFKVSSHTIELGNKVKYKDNMIYKA